MDLADLSVTVGLFGTCDGNTWRAAFIKQYDIDDITYFNPGAGDNWHPGMVHGENKHLMEDDIIIFPILADSINQCQSVG
jgi:hypothetical protein